jgi:ribosomal protein S27E
MRIHCDIEEVQLENDEGREVDGVKVTCSECGNETESFGTGPNSVRRCLVLMRDECPMGGSNFYITDEEEE